MKYESAGAFRDALVARLRDRSISTIGSSSDLDSLLKIASSERFLARLVIGGDGWVLKGGLNLLARLGPDARLTRDADLATGFARSEVETQIRAAAERDLGDYLAFLVREPAPLDADGDAAGLRFRVDCLLADKALATFNVDVVLTEPVPSDIETVELPDLLGFAGLPPVSMPALSPGRQAIEKLHAYTRDYGAQENSRPRDLVDMLALATVLPFDARELRSIGTRVFADRGRQAWPPRLLAPPKGWAAYWDLNGRSAHGLPDVGLDGAFKMLNSFWDPVFVGVAGRWSPVERTWQTSG